MLAIGLAYLYKSHIFLFCVMSAFFLLINVYFEYRIIYIYSEIDSYSSFYHIFGCERVFELFLTPFWAVLFHLAQKIFKI